MASLGIELARERIPGAAPVSAHSPFSAVAEAAPALRTVVVAHPAAWPAAPSRRRMVTLDGEWRRMAMPEDPADPPVGPDFDDSAWNDVFVPDNYGLEPSLSAHFGPVYYRRRLTPVEAPRLRLEFEAVDYLADVWIDHVHLGRHEGYFAPFDFDVTGRIKSGSVLTVRVQDPFEDWSPQQPFFAHAKRVIKGTLKYHDSRPGGLPGMSTPGWNPRLAQSMTTGGTTGSVHLVATADARIDALFVTPLDHSERLIHVALVTTNESDSEVEVEFDFTLASVTDPSNPGRAALRARLRPGPNRLDLRLRVPEARLWWPVSHPDLGRPELYDLRADVYLDGVHSDRRIARFGFRTARVVGRPQRLELNGRPVFVQAANYIGRQHFAGAGLEFYRRDMELLAEAHLNSFGVHGHLQCPVFYEAADERGVLVFQDFPLQWHYDSGRATNPGFIDVATRQIAEMAYTYWNHPSIVYWACHNEPTAMFIPDRPADADHDMDNQVLDEALEQSLCQVETIRHVHRASGIGEDLHLYDGSLSGGNLYDVRRRRSWFVSEYGFWTLGPQVGRWNDQGWPPDEKQMQRWFSRLSFAASTMSFAGLPERYPSLEAWRRATEAYGAYLAKYQTEWMRMNRGDPFWAIRWHFFADWWGWAGGGLVDVDRRRKATWFALQAASRRVMVATSLPNTVYLPGSSLEFALVGINDLRTPVRLRLRWRWRSTRRSLVIGVDREVNRRYLWSSPSDDAMVAMPADDRGTVLEEGSLAASVSAESVAMVAKLELHVPAKEFTGATLELEWDGDQRNWFHVLAAPGGWFCGPGAFIVGPGQSHRLGSEPVP